MIVDVVVDGGLVRAAVVDPPTQPSQAWFVALGFAAWLDETELRRFHRLAAIWRRRLVVVETPGTGGPTRLTLTESRALLRGDFGPLADRLLAAASQASGPISLTGALGYSMGASVAASVGVRAAAADRPLESMVLVEPIAVRRWHAWDLVQANRAQERLNRDAGTPTAGTPPPWVRRFDQYVLVNALRHGRISADLEAAPPMRLVIARGAASPMCDRAGVDRVARLARAEGHRADVVEIPGSHTIWHQPDAVDTIAREVTHALAR